ncbi:hypothetical protein [Streptomyces bauhiniae]|uniref:hypothetical protein n=1 Tax=Streptomyces bauhiniae TaxID=2340725 RepID=UPI0035DC9C5F
MALNWRAPVPRALIAGSLRPKCAEHRAHTNLRAALRGLGVRALDISPTDVRLAADVMVDLRDARLLAQHLLDPGVPPVPLRLSTATVDQLSADLLPGWYDEWSLLESDHWRQLRPPAQQALTETFIDATEYAGAVVAAQAAVQADPPRERGVWITPWRSPDRSYWAPPSRRARRSAVRRRSRRSR